MKRILLADDDKWFAESVKDVLKDNFSLKLVETAEEIFPAIEKFKPDILILDLILGEKNAVTFLNELVSYDDLNDLKIIVLSSVASEVSHESLIELGVTEVIDKSNITPKSLNKTLESIR